MVFRFGLSTLFLGSLSCVLMLLAVQRFPATAAAGDGVLAAAVMASIGGVVGGIVGQQPGARWATLAAVTAFYWALLNGSVGNFGDELTMWAFLCMSGGLACGVLHQWMAPQSAPSRATGDEMDERRN